VATLLVKAGAKPVAGSGIAAAKLGVVKRPDGKLQVTYGGFGLYVYAGDKKAGDANGEQLQNSWYAVSPAAKIVKPAGRVERRRQLRLERLHVDHVRIDGHGLRLGLLEQIPTRNGRGPARRRPAVVAAISRR
jgi:hypothetical protein